jgi:hypothetical protein
LEETVLNGFGAAAQFAIHEEGPSDRFQMVESAIVRLLVAGGCKDWGGRHLSIRRAGWRERAVSPVQIAE